MNRRNFLRRLGMVGVAIAIPPTLMVTKKWHETEYYGPLTAQQFMTKAWNDHMKGPGTKWWPHEMVGSPDLYHSYENGLQCMQRFVSNEPPYLGLAYKSSKFLKMDFDVKGWELYIKEPMSGQYKYYNVNMYGWAV